MTTRSYTDDEFSSQPAVRSVWDAVKSEVTMLAINAASGGCFATAGVLQAVAGDPLVAVINGVVAGLNGLLVASRTAHIVDILKNIPAPKP